MGYDFKELWNKIHTRAKNVRNQNDAIKFCNWVRTVPNDIGCEKCRKHMELYLNQYPPETSGNLYLWTYNFHNDVNRVSGKPNIDFQTFSQLY